MASQTQRKCSCRMSVMKTLLLKLVSVLLLSSSALKNIGAAKLSWAGATYLCACKGVVSSPPLSLFFSQEVDIGQPASTLSNRKTFLKSKKKKKFEAIVRPVVTRATLCLEFDAPNWKPHLGKCCRAGSSPGRPPP